MAYFQLPQPGTEVPLEVVSEVSPPHTHFTGSSAHGLLRLIAEQLAS